MADSRRAACFVPSILLTEDHQIPLAAGKHEHPMQEVALARVSLRCLQCPRGNAEASNCRTFCSLGYECSGLGD